MENMVTTLTSGGEKLSSSEHENAAGGDRRELIGCAGKIMKNNKMVVIDRVFKIAPPGTVIPKPFATGQFCVVRKGKHRRARALIYSIPNKKRPRCPYEKGVTASEFKKAYNQLINTGQLTRRWFKKKFPACEAEGSCNFTTVGGLFILLGRAIYATRGVYHKP